MMLSLGFHFLGILSKTNKVALNTKWFEFVTIISKLTVLILGILYYHDFTLYSFYTTLHFFIKVNDVALYFQYFDYFLVF